MDLVQWTMFALYGAFCFWQGVRYQRDCLSRGRYW